LFVTYVRPRQPPGSSAVKVRRASAGRHAGAPAAMVKAAEEKATRMLQARLQRAALTAAEPARRRKSQPQRAVRLAR